MAKLLVYCPISVLLFRGWLTLRKCCSAGLRSGLRLSYLSGPYYRVIVTYARAINRTVCHDVTVPRVFFISVNFRVFWPTVSFNIIWGIYINGSTWPKNAKFSVNN